MKKEFEKREIYKMLMDPKGNKIENILKSLKKIGVPEDGKWQTLLLYLRYTKDYSFLNESQKGKNSKTPSNSN